MKTKALLLMILPLLALVACDKGLKCINKTEKCMLNADGPAELLGCDDANKDVCSKLSEEDFGRVRLWSTGDGAALKDSMLTKFMIACVEKISSCYSEAKNLDEIQACKNDVDAGKYSVCAELPEIQAEVVKEWLNEKGEEVLENNVHCGWLYAYAKAAKGCMRNTSNEDAQKACIMWDKLIANMGDHAAELTNWTKDNMLNMLETCFAKAQSYRTVAVCENIADEAMNTLKFTQQEIEKIEKWEDEEGSKVVKENKSCVENYVMRTAHCSNEYRCSQWAKKCYQDAKTLDEVKNCKSWWDNSIMSECVYDEEKYDECEHPCGFTNRVNMAQWHNFGVKFIRNNSVVGQTYKCWEAAYSCYYHNSTQRKKQAKCFEALKTDSTSACYPVLHSKDSSGRQQLLDWRGRTAGDGELRSELHWMIEGKRNVSREYGLEQWE